MDLIEEELKDIRDKLPTKVPGGELISCHRNLVSVKLVKTKFKQLTACMQFPKNYPDEAILIEIKSKAFSPTLTNSIGEICDKEAKKYIGSKQVILILKFLQQFLEENPLLPCRDELTHIKKNFLDDSDATKVKQKKGVIDITANSKKYFIKVLATVPDNYPKQPIEIDLEKHNFPSAMAYYFVCQAREFARQATEPPLKKNPRSQPFKASPHLQKVMEFLISKCCKRYPDETCPLCMEKALPSDPMAVVKNPTDDKYVERVYCGHLFHHCCLDKYMKTPPFENGKKCPNCGLRIYHDKWNISPALAERRWAHKEARQRELEEVMDFLS